MGNRVVHIVGNGDHASIYLAKPRYGMKLTCNLPPFNVPDKYASMIVDFKMMKAMHEGSITVPGELILGYRPKLYLEKFVTFRMTMASQIKEFYTELPKYVANYTDFNCGHMAVHYAANKAKATEIHMYGFDSIFDFNLRSCTDFYLGSDRDATNTNRLAANWRPVWMNMFEEFPNTKFILYHTHDALKFPVGSNVSVITDEKMPKNVST